MTRRSGFRTTHLETIAMTATLDLDRFADDGCPHDPDAPPGCDGGG